MKILFSLVVDNSPVFAYQGYHLAKSILQHCGGEKTTICVNVTPGVSEETRAIFRELGCKVAEIGLFGDNPYCNKIAQLPNLEREEFDLAVILDTDTILIEDIRPCLGTSSFQAKTVDMPAPSVAALRDVARLAGLANLPRLVPTDSGVDNTFSGNCNGGFYAIPRNLLSTLAVEWPKWASWLIAHNEPLHREGRERHVDQVSMWLAIQMNGLPYTLAPSNLNYFVHFKGNHLFHKARMPVCVIHYHDKINVLGLIESTCVEREFELEAVRKANEQIGKNFNTKVFWDFRYHQWPERGSGVGSRDQALLDKRALLKAEGIERADSVLDVGCGDLEVLRALELNSYVGLDDSKEALERAARSRPDWTFRPMQWDDASIAPADFVLCMEVLIHQPTAAGYHRLIDFLARKTKRKLIVSGFESDSSVGNNHMLFYYEPLQTSLERSGRFRRVEKIGAHTTVAIYRCIADEP